MQGLKGSVHQQHQGTLAPSNALPSFQQHVLISTGFAHSMVHREWLQISHVKDIV
jgi:hypothetical protein